MEEHDKIINITVVIVLSLIIVGAYFTINYFTDKNVLQKNNVTLDSNACKDWIKANNISIPNESQITHCIINRRTQ